MVYKTHTHFIETNQKPATPVHANTSTWWNILYTDTKLWHKDREIEKDIIYYLQILSK